MHRIRSRTTPVPFSFDLLRLEQYWVKRPVVYHHTCPILHIYALHAALREVMLEGLEARWARHAAAGAHLQGAIRERGMDLLAEPDFQLPQLSAVNVPEGIDGKTVQMRMLREHGIEIGGGLGPGAPPIWRIGLMGENASTEVVDRVLSALDVILADETALSRIG